MLKYTLKFYLILSINDYTIFCLIFLNIMKIQSFKLLLVLLTFYDSLLDISAIIDDFLVGFKKSINLSLFFYLDIGELFLRSSGKNFEIH